MAPFRVATPSPSREDAVKLFYSICDRCDRTFGSPFWPNRALCDVCYRAQLKILHRDQHPVLRGMFATA
jgi:hypothetical protein